VHDALYFCYLCTRFIQSKLFLITQGIFFMTNTNKLQDRVGVVTDERVLRYMSNRYGQRNETRERYGDAIAACGSILYLDKTIAEIAQLFGHQDQSLRNQLKRHFPELVAERERLRSLLRLNKLPVRGVGLSTIEKYRPAIELLRTTNITIRDAAEQTGVALAGLQQHLLFFHKDIAQQRLARRLDALGKPHQTDINGAGRRNEPREATKAFYAKAVKMYRTTDMRVTDIAKACGIDSHNLEGHIRKWYRDDMALRMEKRRERIEAMNRERQKRRENSTLTKMRRKYREVVPLLEAGTVYKEAAAMIGVTPDRLSSWVRRNLPELAKKIRLRNSKTGD
jgi:transposase-like protein